MPRLSLPDDDGSSPSKLLNKNPSSSTTGEEDGRRHPKEESLHHREENNHTYHHRHQQCGSNSSEHDPTRRNDKLPLNNGRCENNSNKSNNSCNKIYNNVSDKNNNSRLHDSTVLNGPLLEEQAPVTSVLVESSMSMSSKKSSPTATSMMMNSRRNLNYPRTEMNGVPKTTSTTTMTTTTATTKTPSQQNGPNCNNQQPLENGTDSLQSLDSIPWNLEGTETIIENNFKSANMKNGSESFIDDEAEKMKEENKKLKAALEEAQEVNGRWQKYHDERQTYVQRLLSTIHELQQNSNHSSSKAPSPRLFDGEVSTTSNVQQCQPTSQQQQPQQQHQQSPQQQQQHQTSPQQQQQQQSPQQEGEVRRLKDSMARLQAEHQEHVQLLEMQVRAHRDDWEAERSEKRSTEATLAETEARAALLLQELQLLRAKLADSESKRGLCWRCMCPASDYNNPRSGSSSRSRTPQVSPIPQIGGSSSPVPMVSSATPPDNPPVSLKGWIPVSMLHHIAFSGATPEHQTPVVQPHPQQPNRTQASSSHQNQQSQHQTQSQQSQRSHQHHQQKNNQQSQSHQGKHHLQIPQQSSKQPQKQTTMVYVPKPVYSTTATQRMQSSSILENNSSKSSNFVPIAEDKKHYEAMGARPKVLENLESVTGKGSGIEDEKSAKHRARSILASAIPISPVSSSPPTGFGVTKSTSQSNLIKGYMPITSTVLTPINFRPPFVAHKRPSAIKHTTHVTKASSQVPIPNTGSSNLPIIHARSDSSPASLCVTSTTNTSITTNAVDPLANVIASSAEQTAKVKQKQVKDAVKLRADIVKADNSHNNLGLVEFIESHRSPSPKVKSSTPNLAEPVISVNVNSTEQTAKFKQQQVKEAVKLRADIVKADSSHNNLGLVEFIESHRSPSPKIRRSSPGVNKEKKYSSNHRKSPSITNITPTPGCTEHVSSATKTLSCSSPPVATTTTTTSSGYNIHGLSQISKPTSIISQELPNSTQLTSTVGSTQTTISSAGNCTNSNGTSNYDSTTSSRSSSPGMSITTFGLNSEGRGIPGAICFALGSEQKGVHSQQSNSSSRTTSSASTITSPPPDLSTAGQSQKDVKVPVGIQSPTILINNIPAPETTQEEHWWSVESPGRNKQQTNQNGKLVNSTWVRLMGGQTNNRQGAGLPWRTARAVSGQHLNQARKTSQEENSSGTTSPNNLLSSTATFNYTPAINSPPSSKRSSANNSASSSPPPSSSNEPLDEDIKTMASKNISSAIMSYEMNAKNEPPQKINSSELDNTSGWSEGRTENIQNDGIETMTRKDLVCPSCQMLFCPERHLEFLDHFEVCGGPKYADL